VNAEKVEEDCALPIFLHNTAISDASGGYRTDTYESASQINPVLMQIQACNFLLLW
jgi:hypothetical protein